MGKKQEAVGYKDETRTSFINFLTEVANYVAVFITAILTMSISIFMDMINSTCNLLRTGISTFLSSRLQKNHRYKYNYGTENLETISMLLCDTLLIIGTAAVMVFAVIKLFNPSEPSEELVVGVAFKAFCVLFNFYLLISNWKVYKKTGTKVAKSNFEGIFGSAGFDFAIFISVLLAFIFRGHGFVTYVEPIASILIAIYVIGRAVLRIKDYVKEITYTTLDEKDQIKITTVLAHHFDKFEDFISVNSHKSGKSVCIDFLLSFPRQTTYGEIISVLDAITKELEETFEDCKVSLIFDDKAGRAKDNGNDRGSDRPNSKTVSDTTTEQ